MGRARFRFLQSCRWQRAGGFACLLAVLMLPCDATADPLPPEAQWRVASVHFSSKRWDLAAEELRLFLRHYPEHPKRAEARFMLAECLMHQGAFAEAREIYRSLYAKLEPGGDATDDSPQSPGLPAVLRRIVVFRLAESAYLAGKEHPASFQEAADLFEAFCRQWPEDPLAGRAWNYLGHIRMKQGRVDEAVNCFRRSLASAPTDALSDAARLRLAECLELSGGSEEAERLYLALAHKPTFPLASTAAWRLARLYQASGRTEEAIAAYEHLIRSWPGYPLAARGRVALAQAYLACSRPQEAIAVLDSVHDHPELGGLARYWRAVAEMMSGNADAALATLDSIDVNAEAELAQWVRLRKAEVYLKVGRPDAAVAELEAGRDAENPSSDTSGLLPDEGTDLRECWLCLAMTAYLSAGEFSQAEALAEKIVDEVAKRNYRPQTRLIAARSLVAQKRYQVALRLLEPLLDADASPTVRDEACFWAASCYLGLGDREAALRLLTDLAESRSANLRAQAALRLCEDARQQADWGVARSWAEKAYRAASAADEPELCAQALFHLAWLAIAAGSGDEARVYKNSLIGLPLGSDRKTQLLYATARKAIDAAHLSLAQEILEEGVDLAEDTAIRLGMTLDLAWCKLQLGDAAKALELLRPWTKSRDETEPLWFGLWYLVAQAAEHAGDEHLAAVGYGQAMTAPDRRLRAEARWQAGRFYHRLGQFELAVWLYTSLYQEDCELVPGDELLYTWAMAERALGSARYPELLQELCTNFPQSPRLAEAAVALAEHAVDTGDFARAEMCLERAETAAVPACPLTLIRARYLRGVVHLAKRQWREAEELFRALLPHASGEFYVGSLFGVAEALYQQHRFEEAGFYFRKLVDEADALSEAAALLDQTLPRAKIRLIEITVAQENWEEAAAKARDFLSTTRAGAEAGVVHFLLGRILYREGRLREAREHLTAAISMLIKENPPVAAEAQLLLAEGYYLTEDYRTALREYLRLEILFPKSELVPGAVLQAARCYWHLGLKDDSVRQLRRLLETWPDSPYAVKAAEWLGTLETGLRPVASPGLP